MTVGSTMLTEQQSIRAVCSGACLQRPALCTVPSRVQQAGNVRPKLDPQLLRAGMMVLAAVTTAKDTCSAVWGSMSRRF